MEKYLFSEYSLILNGKTELFSHIINNETDNEQKWRCINTIKDQEDYIKRKYFKNQNENHELFPGIYNNHDEFSQIGTFREDLLQSENIQKSLNEINSNKTKFINILYKNHNHNECYYLSFIDSFDKEFLIFPLDVICNNDNTDYKIKDMLVINDFQSFKINTDTNIKFVNSYFSNFNWNIQDCLLITDLYSVYYLNPLQDNIDFVKISTLTQFPIQFLSKQHKSSFFILNEKSIFSYSNLKLKSSYDLAYRPNGGTFFNSEDVFLLYSTESIYLYDVKSNTEKALIKHNYNIDHMDVHDDFIFKLYTNKSILYYDIRNYSYPIKEDFLGINYGKLEIKSVKNKEIIYDKHKKDSSFIVNNQIINSQNEDYPYETDISSMTSMNKRIFEEHANEFFENNAFPLKDSKFQSYFIENVNSNLISNVNTSIYSDLNKKYNDKSLLETFYHIEDIAIIDLTQLSKENNENSENSDLNISIDDVIANEEKGFPYKSHKNPNKDLVNKLICFTVDEFSGIHLYIFNKTSYDILINYEDNQVNFTKEKLRATTNVHDRTSFKVRRSSINENYFKGSNSRYSNVNNNIDSHSHSHSHIKPNNISNEGNIPSNLDLFISNYERKAIKNFFNPEKSTIRHRNDVNYLEYREDNLNLLSCKIVNDDLYNHLSDSEVLSHDNDDSNLKLEINKDFSCFISYSPHKQQNSEDDNENDLKTDNIKVVNNRKILENIIKIQNDHVIENEDKLVDCKIKDFIQNNINDLEVNYENNDILNLIMQEFPLKTTLK